MHYLYITHKSEDILVKLLFTAGIDFSLIRIIFSQFVPHVLTDRIENTLKKVHAVI